MSRQTRVKTRALRPLRMQIFAENDISAYSKVLADTVDPLTLFPCGGNRWLRACRGAFNVFWKMNVLRIFNLWSIVDYLKSED